MFKLETFWASENYLFGFKAGGSKVISSGLGFKKARGMCVRLAVLMIVMMMMCVGSAWGEEDEDPLENVSKEIAHQVAAKNAFGSKVGGGQGKVVGVLSELEGLFSSSMIEKEIANSTTGADQNKLKTRAGEKKQDFHTLVTKDAFMKMMKSKEWEKMYDDAVSGENSDGSSAQMIGAMTWGLANSAVGQARYNAIMQTQSALMNHYLSELSFLKQVEMNPNMNENIADAYFSCVRNKVENEKLKDKNYSWFQAQEACMGDDSGIEAGESNEKVKGDLFTFKESYDYKAKDGGSDNGKDICLTDYLFAQENKDESTETNLGKIQNAYRAFLGDVQFVIDGDNDSNTQDQKEDSKGAQTIRKLTYKFVYPGDESNSKCKSTDSNSGTGVGNPKAPYDLFKEMIAYSYKLLIKTLGNYCQQVKRQSSDDAVKNFVTGKEYKKFSEYYTVAGFAVDFQTFQNIYEITNENAEIADDQKISCNIFTNLYSSGGNNGDDDLEKVSNDDSEEGPYKIVLYNLARTVAEIRLYQAYQSIFQYITHSTGFNVSVASTMFSLIDKQIKNVVYSVSGAEFDTIDDLISQRVELLTTAKKVINQERNASIRSLGSDLRSDGNKGERGEETFN